MKAETTTNNETPATIQQPSVGIIILNWKGYADTRACCESLAKLTYPNARVFVVDNASGDGSAEALQSEFPQFVHVANQKNLGFGGGNNAEASRLVAEGQAYILLLNNDTIVAPDFLTAMVNAAEADPQIGMVGAKIYYFRSSNVIWYAGGTVNYREIFPFKHVGENSVDIGQYDKAGETGWITGCCLLARSETLKQVGLLDEAFGYYCEDVDWCLRAKRAGWKIWYEPEAKVWHKIGRSANRGNLSQLYYGYRNIMLVARKDLAGRARISFYLKRLKWVYGYSDFNEEKTIMLEAIVHGALGRGGMAINPGAAKWSNGLVYLKRKVQNLRWRIKSIINPFS